MTFIRKLLALLLVLGMMLSSGIGEAMAISCQNQEETLSSGNTTGPLADLSDIFVVEETEPAAEPEATAPVIQETTEVETAEIQKTEPAVAVNGQTQEFTYTVLGSDTCSVTGYVGTAWGKVVIPETLDGYTVVSIGYAAFSGCKELTELVLPDTVETIGASAFQNCVNLVSFTYPAGLKTVTYGFAGGIFTGCTSLESIEIPEGVTALPDNVFDYAESLKSVKLPSTLTEIGSQAFRGSGVEHIELPDGLLTLDNYAFQYCTALKSIDLGNSLTSIGSGAFEGCTALTELDLPDTVSSIGSVAFKGCVSLASFTYPAGLKTVSYGLSGGIFTGCISLESIEIPEGVTELPDYVFDYAESLKSVKLPSTLTKIGPNAFRGSGVEHMELPNGLLTVGNYAFQNCTALKSIDLGNSLTSIGSGAFEGCTALTELDLPDTVSSIGSVAFKDCVSLVSFAYPTGLKTVSYGLSGGIFTGCTSLASIEIPEGVTELPDYVFDYAESLKSVKLPSTLTKIGSNAFRGSGVEHMELPNGLLTVGNYAFQNCTALESIDLGNSLTTIGTGAFENCTALTELELPDTVSSIGSVAFKGCVSLDSFTYPAGLKTVSYGYSGGIFTGCTALESIEIPEGVTMVPENVFDSAESLKTVILPSTLTTIGRYAFRNSGIVVMDLPDGVHTIEYGAFSNCQSLTYMGLNKGLNSIGGSAFSGCTGLTDLEIPYTVQTIGAGAFEDCVGLTIMILPENLTSLGARAFQDCTALEMVILYDGITQLESDTFSGCTSLSSITMPQKLKKIQYRVFENCESLERIAIPNSVTYIADNAFNGIPNLTFCCDLRAYAAEYALDHQIPIEPTNIPDEELESLLNIENSYYIYNFDGLSASGVMSMVVHYEMAEDAAVSPSAITVHIYDYASLREDTLMLDGVLCTDYEYDEATGRLTVPVTASSGTLRFCMKPLRYEELTSYARLICTDSKGKDSIAIIGTVNALMPVLNITARRETSVSTISVSGLALPEAEVDLIVDGRYVKTVKANKVGDYTGEITLNEPVDGKEYVITAQALDALGNISEAKTTVLYSYKAPELVDFVMIYGSSEISLLDMQGMKPVLRFNSNYKFRFEVDFDNVESLEAVYVVSTRNNVKKYLTATWNESLGLYVAEGYFDPQDHSYVPGVVSLEYVTERERLSFHEAYNVDYETILGIYDDLPQEWQDAQVQVKENTEDSTVLSVTMGTGEDQISFELINTTQSIPDYITEDNIEEYGYTKITDAQGNDWYVREYTKGGNTGEGGAIIMSIIDFAVGQIWDSSVDNVKDAAGNLLSNALGFSLSPIASMFDLLEASADRPEISRQIVEKYKLDLLLSSEPKEDIVARAKLLMGINIGTYIIRATYAVAGIGGYNIPGDDVMMFICDVLEKYIEYEVSGAPKSYGTANKFKWAIDPSGYVYDNVTGERLSGVTVHAYWIENVDEDPTFFNTKPSDEEYGILWDSREYSQLNPLITDADGCYAWDVPEGWWRVSYEKDGYETVWSEWLPVPPPQLEVNIGMTRLVELSARFTSITTSLGGNIAMNFYAELSADLVAAPDAYLQFTFAGKTVTVPVSEGVATGNGIYRFSCPITSKNMTDDITAQFFCGDTPVGVAKSMAVDTYCNWVINNYTDAKTVNLMKAMLNYGASAQLLFSYRTDDLANAALSEADKTFGKVDASAFAHSVTGSEAGIKPTSCTLMLDSETAIRVYFQLTGSKTIEQYTFKVDGVEVTPVYKDGKYYIEKSDIGAHRLDEMHTFTCGGITITYGGLSYVNQVMGYYTSGNTFNMASALFAYSKAAEAYIG